MLATLDHNVDKLGAEGPVGGGIIYLAAPYTDPDPAVREFRYKMATVAAASLAAQGHVVFSPLTMTHPMDQLLAANGETLGSDYWVGFDEAFMEKCSEMQVLCLDGWRRSTGVQREMQFFRSRRRKITLIQPETVADSARCCDVS